MKLYRIAHRQHSGKTFYISAPMSIGKATSALADLLRFCGGRLYLIRARRRNRGPKEYCR